MKKDDLSTGAGQASPAPQKSEVAQREEEILATWQAENTFYKSLEKDAPNGEYVFYDGPPFATGTPHYGHILAGTIKDTITRFWTMNGYYVRRQWGWDCHGLPLENLIEKKLGLGTKRDIEEYGVQNFNEAAREAVLEYRDDWRVQVPRLGRWADMDNDYRTMDPSYTESVWWVFSELNKKGLIYEGFKTMHLCPRCGTTLSNFEVNQGYKDIKDIAVTVKLPLLDESGEVTDTSLLVWTTTPWTLPGNFAAAVHKDLAYVKVKLDSSDPISVNDKKDDGSYGPPSVMKDEFVVLAKERLAQLRDVEYEVVEEFKGEKLVGRSYQPPFDYWQKQEFENKNNAWKIYHADYVEVGEEGTGAVHLAPAYGEDDMNLAKNNNIPIIHHVDESGRFMDFIDDMESRLVKPKDDEAAEISHLDADIEIVRALNAKGVLFRKENITHSYPHCWRCETPLLNYATTSWFVKVTDFKDKLVAENAKVNWVPENIGKNRFGKWLEGARDWAVSRQRYWGAPLPVWRNPETKEVKVFGSLDELQKHTSKQNNHFILMRHGESQSNVQNILNGETDIKNVLTEKGKQQTEIAIENLKKAGTVDYIFYSPLIRTKETAEQIARALEIDPQRVIEDSRITEMRFGEFEGRPASDYRDYFKSGAERLTKAPENGETWSVVKKRAGEFLFSTNYKYTNANILVISHNGTLEMLEAALHGDDFETTARHIEESTYDYMNGEMHSCDFLPYPHNDNYELDFHRPYIDNYEVFDKDGTKLERVPDVFDCWFESGSMPYASNQEFKNENARVADFISESVDQTRGWFYSLIVLGTALLGRSPYKNVITNGLVLAEDGRKMSKSLKNYPDPMELVDRVGADAIRYYLLSSPIIRGEDLNFSEKEVTEQQRKNLGRLHNVLQMYEMFADEGVESLVDSTHILDRWMTARLNQVVTEVTDGYKNYELDKATRPLADLIDDLSVWYLRRSRDRLKGEDETDKKLALGTLRHVLQTLAQVMAPVMPFYADYLWRSVRGVDALDSVHLSTWPVAGAVDEDLLVQMTETREVVTKALEARAKAGIKVRQPVAAVTGPDLSAEIQQIILDEVNAKTYKITDEVGVDTEITPELKQEGDARDFIRAVQDLRKQAGLQPQDRIKLVVQTSDAGETIVQTFMEEIKKVVGAEDIAFGDAAGKEVTAGEYSFTVQVNVS